MTTAEKRTHALLLDLSDDEPRKGTPRGVGDGTIAGAIAAGYVITVSDRISGAAKRQITPAGQLRLIELGALR